MADDLDVRVVGLGAALQLAISVPPAVLVSWLRQDDIGAESNLWLIAAFLVLVLAPAASGVLVGRRRPDTPLLHAALAAAAAWSVLAALSVARAAASGTEVANLLATLLTIAPIQIGFSVLGAFFFNPPRRRTEEIDP